MNSEKIKNNPWKDISEIQVMYDTLFPVVIRSQKHPSLRKLVPYIGAIQECLRKLKVWTRKSTDPLFNVTYELMKKVSEMLKHGDEPDKDFLRDSLSIGLVKIVNAVTNSKQLKGPVDKKLSMTEIAERCGFSVRAVRERNFIAHSQRTPCLRQLIECYREIYRWAHIYLWLPKITEYVNNQRKFELIYNYVEELTLPQVATLEEQLESVPKTDQEQKNKVIDSFIDSNMMKLLKCDLTVDQIQSICD
jgi:AraC-like DNA-binding protein